MTPASLRVSKHMSTLNGVLTKVFRGPLDLNGPILGRAFYLFEYARTSYEETTEAFDARFGTDTAAPTFERNQKTDVHFYVPTTASVIYQIFRELPLNSGKFEFVDMGSGKGRAVLIASEFPFQRIVGIELSEHLHVVAEANVARYKPDPQPCTNIDLRMMNALDHRFGSEPLVLFLFDPFGRDVLEKVISNLEASLRQAPRDVYVVYVYPQYEDVLQKSPALEKTKTGGPRWQPWSQYVIYKTRTES